MIPYEDVVEVFIKTEKLSSTTTVKIDESCGYTVAETIVSNVSVLPFANLAMDNFAMHYTSLLKLSEKFCDPEDCW